jgi:hypothetical protein
VEARFLLVTEPAGFEGFVRAVAKPAGSLTIPPQPNEPPDIAALTAVAAEYEDGGQRRIPFGGTASCTTRAEALTAARVHE